MQNRHYESNPKELKKVLMKAEKFGRMIDAKDVIKGAEHVSKVLCKGCGKIPLKLNI